MNDFTASNGVRITIDAEGDYRFRGGEKAFCVPKGGANEEALREMFRAEDDAALRRWRWPENPDFIVYSDGDDRVNVFYEPGGGSSSWDRADAALSVESDPQRAALAYFDAHPESKPWHEAADGEVWALTGAGGLEQPWRRVGDRWVSFSGEIVYDAVRAIAGRRLWPEVSA